MYMKALIIEDEEIIANLLQQKIEKADATIDVIAKLPSLKTARRWFSSNAQPDMIFMDIQLSDGVSFDLFEQFTLTCPIIFTTAYDEYAVRAIKLNGADYLLKPVDEEELKKAIIKCKKIVENQNRPPVDLMSLVRSIMNPNEQQNTFKEKFVVNSRNQWVIVNTKDIAVLTKDALNYIYLFNGERYILDYDTLDEVEELLDPRQFYRANRQYIINIDAIAAVKPSMNSKLLVKMKGPNDKVEIDMSREKAPLFRKWLNR
jgi:DNA-binding LytR/AlgR family response regulator